MIVQYFPADFFLNFLWRLRKKENIHTPLSGLHKYSWNAVQHYVIGLIAQLFTCVPLFTTVQFLTCEYAVAVAGFAGNLVDLFFLQWFVFPAISLISCKKRIWISDLHEAENCSMQTSCQLINIVTFGIKIKA